MFCQLVYGLGSNLSHLENVPVEEAFRRIPEIRRQGWAFTNIYYNDRLVYTDQGVAGYRYICKDCPYWKEGEVRSYTRDQRKYIF